MKALIIYMRAFSNRYTRSLAAKCLWIQDLYQIRSNRFLTSGLVIFSHLITCKSNILTYPANLAFLRERKLYRSSVVHSYPQVGRFYDLLFFLSYSFHFVLGATVILFFSHNLIVFVMTHGKHIAFAIFFTTCS